MHQSGTTVSAQLFVQHFFDLLLGREFVAARLAHNEDTLRLLDDHAHALRHHLDVSDLARAVDRRDLPLGLVLVGGQVRQLALDVLADGGIDLPRTWIEN